MENPLATDFKCFRNECIKLRNTFKAYEALYESGDATKAVLEKVAIQFFMDLNDWLIDSIFLQVGRLTDQAGKGDKTCLSFAYIAEEVKKQQKCSPRMRELVCEIDKYRDKIASARHKMIAHADLATYRSECKLGVHSEEDASAFFENMQAFTDEVGNAIGVGPLDYRTLSGPGDVFDLISKLKKRVQLDGKDELLD